MLPTSLKHYWLAVTAIALGLLLATRIDANATGYSGQASISGVDTASETFAYGRTVSISEIFRFAELDVLPLDSSDGTRTVVPSDPIHGIRRALQEPGFDSFLERSHLSLTDRYGANISLQVSTATDLESDATPTPPNRLISVGINLSPKKLPVYVMPVKTAVVSLTDVVPRPAALILLGTGLLALVFGIRRITREKSDNRNVYLEPVFAVDARLEANDAEGEPADAVAPLFHQNASGRTDSISLSQSS